MKTAFDGRVANSKEEWLTPPEILKPLGHFDLDPCASVIRPWPTANTHYTISINGLAMPWFGRVWLNPPYGNKTLQWMRRMRDHGNGIALIFARTETQTFFECVWPSASALLFLKGRLRFYHDTGKQSNYSGGAPSVLIAYGDDNANTLQHCHLPGAFVVPSRPVALKFGASWGTCNEP